MLPSHLTTIVSGVCCIIKREYDRKVKSIVDRKPEKKSNNFGQRPKHRLRTALQTRTRLYEAQLSFNHGLKPRLISALLNRVVRSSIIF